jgi:hypothetical protein
MAAFMPLIVIVRVINYGSGDWSISELLFMLIIALVMGTLWGPRVWRGWIETINSERG